MKTADEVAAYIHAETCGQEDPRLEPKCITFIAQALTAFAEERVGESMHDKSSILSLQDLRDFYKDDIERFITKARAKALEEASNILQIEAAEARANKYEWVGDRMNYLAGKILALKGK